MVVGDGEGLPLGDYLVSATPHEATLIEETVSRVEDPQHPGKPCQRIQRLIYDRAADSDALRERLAEKGIDLIVPHRSNRVKPPLQDGRKLRRYKRRWKIERLFAWFGNYRRLVVRYERKLLVYRAFFHVACIMIVLNRF